MKKHNGMRPQDILVLMKIVIIDKEVWHLKDLSTQLGISASEISESVNRSWIAGLIGSDKRSVNRLAFLEFLKYGLRYVFPAQPGPIVRGVPTGHSAAPLNNEILSENNYVWAFARGTMQGQAIEPLYRSVPEVSLKDPEFHKYMSVIDALRMGKAREQKIAYDFLERRIKG